MPGAHPLSPIRYLAGLAIFALPAALAAQQGPRLVVTPSNPRMVARDTLRLSARLLDASGADVPDARIRFFAAAGGVEGQVDSTGLVTSGATGKIAVVVSALVPGSRPVTQRVDVLMVPGPAATVALAPRPARMLAGQRLQLTAIARSIDGDSASDRVTWRSSAPGVVRVDERGFVVAVAPGRATLTAVAGQATTTIDLTVVGVVGGSVIVMPPLASARQGREISHYQPTSPNGKVPNATMTWGVVVTNNLIFVNDLNSGL